MQGQGRMNARAMSSRFSQEAKGCRSKKDRGWESLYPGRKGEGSWIAKQLSTRSAWPWVRVREGQPADECFDAGARNLVSASILTRMVAAQSTPCSETR